MGAALDVAKPEKQEVREKTVASWCLEEQAMEVDIHQQQQGSEKEVTPGMSLWHQALEEVRSSAQLSLCIKQLQKSVQKLGDNEELLFLCHGCYKGCHTYCHRPRIPKVHDGKWFCRFCEAKNRAAGGGKRGRAKLDSRGSCAKKAKLVKDYRDWLEMYRVVLAELEAHPDARPFLFPVNLKAAPWYKRIIKKPMDFSTIGKQTQQQPSSRSLFALTSYIPIYTWRVHQSINLPATYMMINFYSAFERVTPTSFRVSSVTSGPQIIYHGDRPFGWREGGGIDPSRIMRRGVDDGPEITVGD
ncbi:unnamed protein product [Pleuronectes platessa]|uniref:Bromo domain-containing protein n=1 Tax=Pleuronectes platessa TaxID=8262 RepID=A0A9N7YNA2_PLEPL|nr:unnamed protein product [Pleuronectes platessa]